MRGETGLSRFARGLDGPVLTFRWSRPAPGRKNAIADMIDPAEPFRDRLIEEAARSRPPTP